MSDESKNGVARVDGNGIWLDNIWMSLDIGPVPLAQQINIWKDHAVREAVLKERERCAAICEAKRFYDSGLAQSCEDDSQEREDMEREDRLAWECEELRDAIRQAISQTEAKAGK